MAPLLTSPLVDTAALAVQSTEMSAEAAKKVSVSSFSGRGVFDHSNSLVGAESELTRVCAHCASLVSFQERCIVIDQVPTCHLVPSVFSNLTPSCADQGCLVSNSIVRDIRCRDWVNKVQLFTGTNMRMCVQKHDWPQVTRKAASTSTVKLAEGNVSSKQTGRTPSPGHLGQGKTVAHAEQLAPAEYWS
jgi:hypothetical protein